MKILLSPAKSLDYSKTIAKPFVQEATFLKETEQLVTKLKKIKPKKFMEMMHISSDLAHLNYDRYQAWTSPTEESEVVKACIEVFNGEVYKGLDPFSWNETELIRANEQIRILSGLYGILKPLDLVYPYRLEMGTKWQITPKVKNLYAFWSDKLTKQLNAEKPEEVLNLASGEYNKVINFKQLKAKVITPTFKDFSNGSYKVVMMYAKHARGAMANYCIKNHLTSLEDLKVYNVDGYTFDAKTSSETEWNFIR
jgi:cytoplasmic iron level regulating protein YaaA (DUF328/UPF0246 family)